MTLGRTDTGTNNLLGGQPLGARLSPLARFTSVSIGQVTAPATQFSGRMGFGSLAEGSGSKTRESASGLAFCEPGLNDKEKFKRVKNKAHLA